MKFGKGSRFNNWFGDAQPLKGTGISVEGVNLANRSQAPHGKLTALYQSKQGPGGFYWQCRCECGGTREVLAKRFTTYEIKSCIDCRIRPLTAQSQYRDKPWYSERFRRTWRKLVEAMPYERRLLYETYLVGRSTRHWQFQMQAAQIALLDKEPIAELKSFNIRRVAEAMATLKSRGIYPPPIEVIHGKREQ